MHSTRLVRLLWLVLLDDQHVQQRLVDLDLVEMERRKSRLKELVGIATEQVRELGLRLAPLASSCP